MHQRIGPFPVDVCNTVDTLAIVIKYIYYRDILNVEGRRDLY